ncbi:ArnT family glycosyltransferase [Alteromonas sp. AMM-1]|uniref:ArnT family glycosyltransferase n=1 Tax=Alteromonas sp. AMM-1 TaxID=3394233 RepID=UPI0039A597DE
MMKSPSMAAPAVYQAYPLVVLLSFAALLILTGLGLRDPWPADEPRFALIARDMVDTGQWFFPMRGGEIYPDKPPVFMWAIAMFYALTGNLKLAFLLPSALAGLATVWLVYDLGRRLWNVNTGFIAGLLMLFTVQFTLQAKTAQIDALVCAFITLGCYGLLRFMLTDGLWRWYYLAWFSMGLGVITKGVGFLPALMLVPYWLYRIKTKNTLIMRPYRATALKWWLGPVVMLFAISLWFVPMYYLVSVSDNPAFHAYRDNILFKQTVTRYADSWHHIKPFWYYLTSVIPVFWLPVSVALPWLVPKWWRAIRQMDARILLPAGWIVLLLLFFSLSPGKRGVYIMPAVPMLALIAAPYCTELLCRRGLSRLIFGLCAVLTVIFATAGISALVDAHWIKRALADYDVDTAGFFITAALLGAVSLLVGYRQAMWKSWPILISGLWILYSTWGYHLMGPIRTPESVFASMQQHIPDDSQIALVEFAEQFILFSPYPVTHFGYHTPTNVQLQGANQWLDGDGKRYLLLADEQLQQSCFNAEQAIEVGFAHRHNWYVVNADAKTADCEYPADPVKQYGR